MNSERLYPRGDQIEELTRGVKLPLAPLNDNHIVIIAEMLAEAWKHLLQSQRQTLLAGNEAEINALMETRLNIALEKTQPWSILVSNVARGKETSSFDGSHLEKRPDLSIQLTDRNRNFPLVVECKIIDHSSQQTVKLYCNNGIVRFVLGEYAWANREAFMLAYVRDGSSIKSSLTPLLRKSQKSNPDPYCTEKVPVSANPLTLDLACSRHSRNFHYLSGLPNNIPGPIDLWHLWIGAKA